MYIFQVLLSADPAGEPGQHCGLPPCSVQPSHAPTAQHRLPHDEVNIIFTCVYFRSLKFFLHLARSYVICTTACPGGYVGCFHVQEIEISVHYTLPGKIRFTRCPVHSNSATGIQIMEPLLLNPSYTPVTPIYLHLRTYICTLGLFDIIILTGAIP